MTGHERAKSDKMQKIIFCLWLIGFIVMSFPGTHADVLFHDDFNGSMASSDYWHIPTRKSPPKGTFIGRTQFKCTQDSALPAQQNGNAMITLESHNPTRLSFYGTDLISNQSFALGQGIRVRVRAKMDTSVPGIVGGIFLYALNQGETKICDEIDFELLTNHPNDVRTNVYRRGGPATGAPQSVPYPSGSITGYHTYEIEWLPDQVSWFIDGNLVRTERENVPTGVMTVHLNLWAPNLKWTLAYSSELKPVRSPSSNKIFSMSVDSVDVESIAAK